MSADRSPLLDHPIDAPSVFTPGDLMDAVRRARQLDVQPVPPLCILDFDGDLSDGLVRDGTATPSASWACFHTQMLIVKIEGMECGVVPRTIGGPYAVLIAEQLHAAGARLIVGLTSAGRLKPDLPMPSIVVADEAVRDEGTSLHYVQAATTITTPTPTLVTHLSREFETVSLVEHGLVWTTDAPYRETEEQLQRWATAGALAVEMQAASLFAFATASGAHVGLVALVSNSPAQSHEQFDTGGHGYRLRVLTAVARAAGAFLDGPHR
ncbi:MAG: nucleoside phosphorylase [Acidobacteriota bacterium]|nr:nucleoside phosphorylase [Acidobacteriota bacterium]